MHRDLDIYQWKPFIEKLEADWVYHAAVSRMFTEPEDLRAFQLNVWSIIQFHPGKIPSVLEDERKTITFSNMRTRFIFKIILADDTANPVRQCKEEWLGEYTKFSIIQKREVVCISLKFLPAEGKIESWGVAIFSSAGELLKEDGTIRLDS